MGIGPMRGNNSLIMGFILSCLEQSFRLVQLDNCKISFIWIALLERQVNASTVYFSCIMQLYKYDCCFCFTFLNQHVLKRKLHYSAILFI